MTAANGTHGPDGGGAAVWHCVWKPAFDDIVETGASPDRAVEVMLDYGSANKMATPTFYVSTAITSAGWRRHPDFEAPEKIPQAIEHNNRTTSTILGNLVENPEAIVSADSLMAPTDLGKVPGWGDTDYLIFYFAWAGGLTASGASRFASSFDQREYEPILLAANDRQANNDSRWPSYRVFTEIAITKLLLTETYPTSRAGEGASTLLQVIDVEASLGCRAERLFADARGLDVIIPTLDSDLFVDPESDFATLSRLGVTVGAPRNKFELIPIALR
jgi:hypothetical protein